MDTEKFRYPAVLRFADHVLPLLETVGVDIDTVTVPITVGPGYVRYQRFVSLSGGDEVREEFRFADTGGIMDALDIDVAGRPVMVTFEPAGPMVVTVDGINVGESLVVYPSQTMILE